MQCCCSKQRKELDYLFKDAQKYNLKNLAKIMEDCQNEEEGTGMKSIEIMSIVSELMAIQSLGKIQKKELVRVFRTILPKQNQSKIKLFMTNNYFFMNETQQVYDFNKVTLFCILYCCGDNKDKTRLIFNIVQNYSNQCVVNNTQKLIQAVETLLFIPSVVVSEVLIQTQRYNPADYDHDLYELIQMYSHEKDVLEDFAKDMIGMYLFPPHYKNQFLREKEFTERMKEFKYIFLNPVQLREKFTIYIFDRKQRGMLPIQTRLTSKPLINDNPTLYKPSSTQHKQEGLARNSARGSLANLLPNDFLKSYSQESAREEKKAMTKGNAQPDQDEQESVIYKYDDVPQSSLKVDKKQYSRPQSQVNVNDTSLKGSSKDLNEFTLQGPLENPSNQISQDTLNMSKLLNKKSSGRDTNETLGSYRGSLYNLNRFTDVQHYLKEMFGLRFVNYAKNFFQPLGEPEMQFLEKSFETIKKSHNLKFPEFNDYPYQIRELYEYFKMSITKQDLIDFAQKKLYKDNIINVYLRVLEKINLVKQSAFNYNKAKTKKSPEEIQGENPKKILYYTTTFTKKLNKDAYLEECLNQLQYFGKYDYVMVPFFIDEVNDKRCLIVQINNNMQQVDLYDKERETDNHDISDTVLHMMELAAKLQDQSFHDDKIDGSVEGVPVDNDEDMIVACCHIAEQMTLNYQIEMQDLDVDRERTKILYSLIKLLFVE
ncbi:UNKNOWN [Stylonychia lemnae]|uniref:Uncharacterized protein n=1 Tax=Stylonychia lemnae TaxID=5949 RepID=A0A077ZZ04_STYLE|nr:UNKNOWN [Stylonychia lemnae]|eukprot:CDW73763.1 UNKNOWN [Stylonychia lemnae]